MIFDEKPYTPFNLIIYVALDFEVSKSLNEGTYQSTVIVPAIRVVLRNFSFRTSSFITTSERQSIASADRKGDGQWGDVQISC